MDHPAWLLVPWAVFALAALVKVWQITALFRRRIQATRPQSITAARARLEQIWKNDSVTRG